MPNLLVSVNGRNKWENQKIRKKNRKFGKERWPGPSIWEKRMINMKQNKYICNNLIAQNYITNNEDIMSDDMLSSKHSIIPVWICSHCTYTNVERMKYCNMCYSAFKSNVSFSENKNSNNYQRELILSDYINNKTVSGLLSANNIKSDDELLSVAIELSLQPETQSTV
eukprot:479775_1